VVSVYLGEWHPVLHTITAGEIFVANSEYYIAELFSLVAY